jgi:hypothetical protein
MEGRWAVRKRKPLRLRRSFLLVRSKRTTLGADYHVVRTNLLNRRIDSYVEPGLPDQVRIQFNGGESGAFPQALC